MGLIIRELVESYSADGVDYAVIVEDLKENRVVYSKDGETLLNPASNMKVLTTFAALAHWGNHYRFSTQLLGEGEIKAGTLPHLILKGLGDPTLTSERLSTMAFALKAKGIDRVERLTLDETYFKVSDFPGRFDGRQRDAPFNATVGAISLDDNVLQVEVEPGAKAGGRAEVRLCPDLPGFPIEAEVSTRGKRPNIVVKNAPSPEEFQIKVSGNIPPRSGARRYLIAYPHPTQFAGWRLVRSLAEAGILAPAAFQVAAGSRDAKLLVEEKSPPLPEILREINKESNNFMAEQLTIGLGAAVGGEPGDTAKGIRVIHKLLRGLGIDLDGLFMENGSGLSKNTRIRARTLLDVLHQAYQNPKLRETFLSSLSIMGVDGTLRKRYRGSSLEGYFIGKTGTLNGVTSLSGYAFRKSAPNDPPYLFAFIANGSGQGFWKMKELQGKILETLINQLCGPCARRTQMAGTRPAHHEKVFSKSRDG